MFEDQLQNNCDTQAVLVTESFLSIQLLNYLTQQYDNCDNDFYDNVNMIMTSLFSQNQALKHNTTWQTATRSIPFPTKELRDARGQISTLPYTRCKSGRKSTVLLFTKLAVLRMVHCKSTVFWRYVSTYDFPVFFQIVLDL